MIKCFEQQGKMVSVMMICEGFVEQNEIFEELLLLLKEFCYWLCEILLCVDGELWFVGCIVVFVLMLSGLELVL